MAQVYILGTSHDRQIYGDGQIDSFIQKICTTKQIRAIAEEMNADGLAEKRTSATRGQLIATKLGIAHKHCDPSRQERQELGILQVNDVLLRGWFYNLNEDQLRKTIREEQNKREIIWVEEVRALNTFPTLFICGSDHANFLAKLFEVNGIEAEIIEESH